MKNINSDIVRDLLGKNLFQSNRSSENNGAKNVNNKGKTSKRYKQIF